MAADEFWMIVDVTDVFDTPYSGERIPKEKAPVFMHYHRCDAEQELLRLQKKKPHCEFVLMEAMARAVPRMETVYVVQEISKVPF